MNKKKAEENLPSKIHHVGKRQKALGAEGYRRNLVEKF